MNRLRRLFAPSPEGQLARRRALPYLGVGAFIVVVLLAIPPAWEYSNSVPFCGETCHTMPPEYQTYLVSPHARVLCVDCHIGRGLIIQQAYRKVGHMRLIWATLTNSYEYPIRVSSMRPARETCELCHFPEKFSDDSLREQKHFRQNEENTPYSIYLLMHTGGGSARQGLGFGIHWHVENPIAYIATDELDQEIPWVRVTAADGTTTEYVAQDAEIDLANLDQYEIKQMDCMTCHNRISHLIEPPRQLVDSALNRGDIPRSVPNIRYMAETLLGQSYESAEEARAAFETLHDYYRDLYPAFYEQNADQVAQTVQVLEELWTANNYVEQELNWQTHPDNIGHRDWPGCFRCHDGQHFNAEGEAVRLECNLCHSIPLVVRPTDIEPVMPLTTGLEPESHLDSTWISRHHNEFDRTCANCHTVENPGGTSDTSFCSNSACHGVRWKFAGFDAPALALEMGLLQEAPGVEVAGGVQPEELTYQDLRPVLQAECGECHGSNPTAGLQVTDYAALLAGSRNGPVLVPGDVEGSRIFTVLGAGHFGALTTAQLELLRAWVANGAPEGQPPAAVAATYQAIQPILAETCGECHGPDDPTRGLNVTEYATLMAGGRSGPAVTPGDVQGSLIIEVLEEGHFARLTDEQMALLREWIASGAPETEAGAAPAPAEGGEGAEAALTYAAIQPILTRRCGECHGETNPARGLRLTDYDGLLAGSAIGPVIVPGEPGKSYLLQLLQEGHPGQLARSEYILLRDWIAQGAPRE